MYVYIIGYSKSINQISIAPISLVKQGSKAWQPNWYSTAKLDEAVPYHQQAIRRAGVYRGKFVAHAFTICGICGIIAVTLIWIVQNYLQLLLCPVVLIIAIPFCMVSPTVTSQGFMRVQNWLAPLGDKVSSIYSQCSTALFPSLVPLRFTILFKINLLSYKTLHEKQPVYLHSMLATSLPSHSLRSNKDNSLVSPKSSRPNTGARAFHSCAPSLWNNLPLSVHSAIAVATFKKHLNMHLFDLAFPHRHRHAWWPNDVMEQILCGEDTSSVNYNPINHHNAKWCSSTQRP